MEHLFDRLNLEHCSQKQYISVAQANALKYSAISRGLFAAFIMPVTGRDYVLIKTFNILLLQI